MIWYLENTVLDDSYEQRPDGVTLNTLTFPHVGRQHLHVRLVCQASNTNLAPPETNVLILDINCKYYFVLSLVHQSYRLLKTENFLSRVE